MYYTKNFHSNYTLSLEHCWSFPCLSGTHQSYWHHLCCN